MNRRRTLVLGGARCGKSRYAESLLDPADHVRYVATGYPPRGYAPTRYPPDEDAEWAHRVRIHQQRRPDSWRTLETTDLISLFADESTPLLVDCLSLWLTRTMDACRYWDRGAPPEEFLRAVDATIRAWAQFGGTAVAVSNEVGLGVVPETSAGRRFRDELGTLNQRLAAESDDVWLLVAGLPLRLK